VQICREKKPGCVGDVAISTISRRKKRLTLSWGGPRMSTTRGKDHLSLCEGGARDENTNLGGGR